MATNRAPRSVNEAQSVIVIVWQAERKRHEEINQEQRHLCENDGDFFKSITSEL